MKLLCKLITFMLFVSATSIFANKFSPEATYQLCFTPEENCTQLIMDEIAKAKHKILVQAYVFTSSPIAKALVVAKKRGIVVKILLDKSQLESKSLLSFFIQNNIPIFIDYVRGIAHNKLILIDDMISIGGSFNYTPSAQKNNAENVTIIRDSGITKKYVNKWYTRFRRAVAID